METTEVGESPKKRTENQENRFPTGTGLQRKRPAAPKIGDAGRNKEEKGPRGAQGVVRELKQLPDGPK